MAADITFAQSDWLPPEDTYQTATQRLPIPAPAIHSPQERDRTTLPDWTEFTRWQGRLFWTPPPLQKAVFDV